MSRKSRREQRRESDINNTWKDLKDYVSGSERLISAYSDSDISEIAYCVTFYHQLRENLVNKKAPSLTDCAYLCCHFASAETMDEVKEVFRLYKGDPIYEGITKFYPKVYERFAESDSFPKRLIGIYFTLLSAEAMKKGFESLLTHVRFIKITLYMKDGVPHIMNEYEIRKAETWVKMQEKYLRKWDISIKFQRASSNSHQLWEGLEE